VVSSVIETKYPLSFRSRDSVDLGEQIRLRHSLEVVGAKRVGISDFLRFFLFRRGVVEKFIDRNKLHLFISVDLNDLVEREVFPFWILTLKRIADSLESFPINLKSKKEISLLFLDSIQSQDLFLTIENIRKALLIIVGQDILPTIFFLRFDRVANNVDDTFFANLEGLIDLTHHRLAFVFTSFRKMDEIVDGQISRNFLQVFANTLFLAPADFGDAKIIFDTFKKRYKLKIRGAVERELIRMSGGHVQLLHLTILVIQQKKIGKLKNYELLFEAVSGDERIRLQCEEIWASLQDEERKLLIKVIREEEFAKNDKDIGKYLLDTGLVIDREYGSSGLFKKRKEVEKKIKVFSPLFAKYIENKIEKASSNGNIELTKKESTLYNFLLQHFENVCEREFIVEAVWPESEELGVSDWTIDRLVARLREKLKLNRSKYKIITVKTRGFKLSK